MVYKVELTAEAVSNIRNIRDYIGASESQAAARWYRGLREAIFSLDRLPGRGSRTHEDRRFKQLLYGNKPHIYRIIYRIDEPIGRVLVVHIRHSAQSAFPQRPFEDEG